MASSIHANPAAPVIRHAPVASRPAHHAYRILHVGFTVLPILAGADKFFLTS